MSVRQSNKVSYGFSDPLIDNYPLPIVSQRAPTGNDKAQIGTMWIDQPNEDVYIIVAIDANQAVWINSGGGPGTFSRIDLPNTDAAGDGAIYLGGDLFLHNYQAGITYGSTFVGEDAGNLTSSPTKVLP